MILRFLLKTLLLIILFVLTADFSNIAFGQKAIQLTNVTSGKQLILKEGHRVSYSLKDSTKRITGTIEKINDGSVIISGKDLKPDDLRSIGRKRSGSGFWIFAGSALGTGIIIGSIQSSNYDPCPSCTDAGSTGEGWTVVEIGLGAALIGLSINTAVRNSPKDVIAKWKLEIIELPSTGAK